MNDSDIYIRENIGVVYDGDNFPGQLSASKQLSQISWKVSINTGI